MMRQVFAVVCCALVAAPAAIGQVDRSNQTPGGLSASDWSGIQAALQTPHGADQPAQGGETASLSVTIDSIAQQAYLKASNTGVTDRFGYAVAVSGDTVAVGADKEDSNATGVNGDQADNSLQDSGAVYIFVRSGTGWIQEAYLKASNSGELDNFGISLAMSGNTLVVGARNESSNATGVNGNESDNSAVSSGAAYVFVRSGSTWTQQAYLKASNTGLGDLFGLRVGLSDNTALVGAWSEDSSATGVDGDGGNNGALNSGAAYVFVRNGTTWSQQAYLKASNAGAGDDFGRSVAVGDNTVVVGARNEQSSATGVNGEQGDDSADEAGAAYIFVRNGMTWSQQAYIKASNTEANDRFGHSVAMFGQTLVVGAYLEDSNAVGVNGDQFDNSTPDSGAAYVFLRTGTHWSQQAYLKASNTDDFDRFSLRLSVLGDTLVVGAYQERSNAVGVNGDDSDNSSPEAGAAYLFVRSGEVWSFLAYLKASNTGLGDNFGRPVKLSGDTLVIGAWPEDSNSTGINSNQADNSASSSGAVYIFDLAAWSDEGCALAGVSGDPRLVGTGTLADGSENAFGLSYAAPSSACGLFFSVSSSPIPFKGGTLKAFPYVINPIILATGPTGALAFPSFTMPSGLPPGTNLWLQYVIVDAAATLGFSFSNAIVGTTP